MVGAGAGLGRFRMLVLRVGALCTVEFAKRLFEWKRAETGLASTRCDGQVRDSLVARSLYLAEHLDYRMARERNSGQLLGVVRRAPHAK